MAHQTSAVFFQLNPGAGTEVLHHQVICVVPSLAPVPSSPSGPTATPTEGTAAGTGVPSEDDDDADLVVTAVGAFIAGGCLSMLIVLAWRRKEDDGASDAAARPAVANAMYEESGTKTDGFGFGNDGYLDVDGTQPKV